MAVRDGLVWMTAGLLAFGAAGCSSSETPSSQASSQPGSAIVASSDERTLSGKVLCPAGAPALASLGLAEAGAEVDYVEGQDLLISELSKTDGEYDMIIAPVNVGVRTWKEAGAYQLDGILTWGNLYLVSENDNWNEEGRTIALFGENAVPGLVFDNLYPNPAAEIEYYPSTAEASAALLAKKADSALLAQPAAAGALSRAAEQGMDLHIVEDLQTVWKASHSTEHHGYPQAALFVRTNAALEYQSWIESLNDFILHADSQNIEQSVEKAGAEKLGVPNAKLAASTWEQQNIDYVPASEAKSDLSAFLEIFGIEIPEGLIAD